MFTEMGQTWYLFWITQVAWTTSTLVDMAYIYMCTFIPSSLSLLPSPSESPTRTASDAAALSVAGSETRSASNSLSSVNCLEMLSAQ